MRIMGGSSEDHDRIMVGSWEDGRLAAMPPAAAAGAAGQQAGVPAGGLGGGRLG